MDRRFSEEAYEDMQYIKLLVSYYDASIEDIVHSDCGLGMGYGRGLCIIFFRIIMIIGIVLLV